MSGGDFTTAINALPISAPARIFAAAAITAGDVEQIILTPSCIQIVYADPIAGDDAAHARVGLERQIASRLARSSPGGAPDVGSYSYLNTAESQDVGYPTGQIGYPNSNSLGP